MKRRLDGIGQDVVHALRVLRRTPAFGLIAVAHVHARVSRGGWTGSGEGESDPASG